MASPGTEGVRGIPPPTVDGRCEPVCEATSRGTIAPRTGVGPMVVAAAANATTSVRWCRAAPSKSPSGSIGTDLHRDDLIETGEPLQRDHARFAVPET